MTNCTPIRRDSFPRKLMRFFLFLLIAMATEGKSLRVEEPSAKEVKLPFSPQSRRETQERDDDDNYACSLCQGLTLLADKIPQENATCAEMDFYFRQPEFKNLGHAGFAGNGENATNNNPGTCRADFLFGIFFEQCCRASIPVYECEQNVHDLILGDLKTNNYNPAVPPIMDYDNPLNVSVYLQHEQLEDLKVEQGTATIFLSLTLKWMDSRLKWDIEDNNTCTNVIDVYTGHDIETSQIWVPNLDVLNRIEGVQTMTDSKASIFSDGTVHWYLMGGVEVFCAFRGLANIPFDTLGCQLMFGSQTRMGSSAVNYVIEVPEFVYYGAFEVTYNEWQPVPEKAKQGYSFDDGVIVYNFWYRRATLHYIQNIVVPTVILTYLSFFTFLLDLRVGERLGFGMALALVVVAQQIVTSGMTPISDQHLWLDRFVAYSFYWVLFGVIQSVCMGFLFYLREDRQARKERKVLEAMTPGQRASMMQRAALEITEGEEEEEGLLNKIENESQQEEFQDARKDSSSKIVKSEESWKDNSLNGIRVEEKDDCAVKEVSEKCCSFILFKFSIRKLDFICLVFALISYTGFVIGMLYTGQNGGWPATEPLWFDEEATLEQSINSYPNQN